MDVWRLSFVFCSLSFFCTLLVSRGLSAQEPDWSQGAVIPVDGRPNPYSLPNSELANSVRAGRVHALHYPVEATGMIVPYQPLKNFIEASDANPLRQIIEKIFGRFDRFKTFNDIETWLGLPTYPKIEGSGAYLVPLSSPESLEHHMGFTLVDTPHGRGFTISCAECHSANLFGKRVIGLSNRFPRANRFFQEGIQLEPYVSETIFQWSTGATDGETRMFADLKNALQFVDAKAPVQLGLDTSLAQVALSLAMRAPDAWATQVADAKARPDPISNIVADSKPAVWWNLKY
jgi:hypothetical protein